MMAPRKVSEEADTAPVPWRQEVLAARTLPFPAVPTKLSMAQ